MLSATRPNATADRIATQSPAMWLGPGIPGGRGPTLTSMASVTSGVASPLAAAESSDLSMPSPVAWPAIAMEAMRGMSPMVAWELASPCMANNPIISIETAASCCIRSRRLALWPSLRRGDAYGCTIGVPSRRQVASLRIALNGLFPLSLTHAPDSYYRAS